MENSKKRFIPTPPEGFFSKGNMKMDMSAAGFTIPAGLEEIFWAHHTKHHLDANGDWKPELKEKGLRYMKDYQK
ncbi:MAG: hypothetical protein WCO63_00330 [Bacteroidota bacterium]